MKHSNAIVQTELAKLQSIAAQTLEYARKLGVDQAETNLQLTEGFSLNVHQADVETLEHNRERNLSVTVYLNHCTGTATTSDLSSASIQAVVAKACTIARYTNQDPCAGLAETELLAQDFPDLNLYHPWEITPKEAIDLAIVCEQQLRQQDARISKIDGVSIDTHQYASVYANTNHFLNGVSSTRHSISCTPIAEADGQMQRDYEYTVARDPRVLLAPELLAQQAATKVLARLGAKPINTTRCPVIFAAPVARGLLNHFIRAISGGNLYRKSSFLLNQMDKAIFPSFVKIWQEPHLRGGWASSNYDSDGVATRPINFIDNGILQSYVLGHYSACKLGLKTTGNAGGVYNLFINHQDESLNALMKRMGKGLLVTELMGQGVNLLTGDYSRGAFGFWVEGGEIQYPVEEVTIAANLKDMFANMVAVAADRDPRSSIQTGSILLNEMMVGGL